MGLPDPGVAQAGFAGAVISAGAAWFGLYVNSGNISSTMQPSPKIQLSDLTIQPAQLLSNNVQDRLPSSETDTTKLPKYRIQNKG